jgi:hypothetical protein
MNVWSAATVRLLALSVCRGQIPIRVAHIPEKWKPVFRKGYAPAHES